MVLVVGVWLTVNLYYQLSIPWIFDPVKWDVTKHSTDIALDTEFLYHIYIVILSSMKEAKVNDFYLL